MPRQKKRRGKGKKKASASKNPVTSSSVKLKLADASLAFGDIEDIFEDQVIDSEGGTIKFTINVRRKFMQGDYIMHIVKNQSKEDDTYTNVAILCREDVDPLKIHDLLKDSNFGQDFRCKNFISRYDWKHFRNWGSFKHEEDEWLHDAVDDTDDDSSDDWDSSEDEIPLEFFIRLLWNEVHESGIANNFRSEAWELFCSQVAGEDGEDIPPPEPKTKKLSNVTKSSNNMTKEEIQLQFQKTLLEYFQNDTTIVRNCTLFINSERLSEISDGQFTIEKDDHWIYIIYGKKDNGNNKNPIGFILRVTDDGDTRLISGDWHYGCVLKDEKSEECFAFVFGDSYIYNSWPVEIPKFNVEETDYTYKIRDFLRSGGPLPGASVYSYDEDENDDSLSERQKTKIMEEYIGKATSTNVIVLDDMWRHAPFNKITPAESWESNPDVEGPTCHLCEKEISSDVYSFVYKDTRYTKIFKNVFTSLDLWDEQFIHEVGELQCCYCFNYFHRMKCSLSMSDSTYFNFKVSKNWSCPACVPSVPFNYTRIPENGMSSDAPNSTSKFDPRLILFIFFCIAITTFFPSPFP